jgi:hypothetical protein
MAANLNDFADDFVARDCRHVQRRPSGCDPIEIAATHAAVRDTHQHFVVANFIDGNGARTEQS